MTASFRFLKTRQIRQFLAFLIQNVNVARFARNVEWDFFCDFQIFSLYFHVNFLPSLINQCLPFLLRSQVCRIHRKVSDTYLLSVEYKRATTNSKHLLAFQKPRFKNFHIFCRECKWKKKAEDRCSFLQYFLLLMTE